MKKLILLLTCVIAFSMAFVAGCELNPKQSNVDNLPEQSVSEDSANSSFPDSSFVEDSSVSSAPDSSFVEDSSQSDYPDENDHVHDYKAVVTSPTCLTAGYTIYTCSSCGDFYVADEVSALGHSYNAVVTPPTYEKDGYTTYTCSVCNYSYISDRVGALEHNYTAVVTAPTCSSVGYTTYTCVDCGDTYISDRVDALEHNYKSVVTVPTCSSAGFTTYTCVDCGDSYVSDRVGTLEHNYKSVVTAPTCSTGGYATYTCVDCGDTYISDRVDALEHNYKSVVTAPTCTAGGYATYTCTVCGNSYVSDRVNALGHSYESVVTAPTCTSEGYTTYTCVDCSYSYKANSVVALGHDWIAATTSAPKTCKVCGATEGDKLPSGGEVVMPTETLYVSYIDVGQGDSMLIKLGDCDILIDGGTSSYGSTVNSYLKSQGVDDIELMINTHLDTDHFGGLSAVLSSYKVEDFWRSNYEKINSSITTFKNNVTKEGLSWTPVSVGTIFTHGYLTLSVLYNGTGASSSNDSSLVVMLQYGEVRFLFTGDISSTIENKLVKDSNIDLSCDVLKVAHHGSKNSSSSAFCKATGAKYGVICVGAGNTYGHPTSTAMNNLKAAGITYYRTDKDGDVVFSTDGSTLTIPGGNTVDGGSGSSFSGSSSSSSSSSNSDTFIGNKESKVFHLPTCGNLPDVSKRNYLYNYWFIVNCIGYRPCQVCLKNYTP